MKRNILIPALALCLLLTGCGWMERSYLSVTPHREQRQSSQTDVIAAGNYLELLEALESIIAAGTEVAAINVAEYPEDAVEHGIERAVLYAMKNDPIGSYAVEGILYELGTNSGQPALSLNIAYRHNRSEIQRIRDVVDMEAAEAEIADALEGYDASIVLLVEKYATKDFTQFVHDYADLHPETVMEAPQVTENVYGTGRDRVVELIFTYQTSRDSLRRMQSQVQPIFDSASLYVTGDGEDHQKFSQLYAFLMERFDYKVETSITPAYSLLRHGVGDSRAFATVYAAMCRSAGLECMTVTGTRAGEPWTWNIVLDDGQYYHVDLLRSSEQGKFREYTDDSMGSYVWDYSDYPKCNGENVAEETTEPTETAETVPVEKS
ncbi:MAG: transglutaminase domain-containing protein [Oscillospiraceae bacterium]|nr:transglutaminase domain-containing protein [Oscillospiraceae bacterium]